MELMLQQIIENWRYMNMENKEKDMFWRDEDGSLMKITYNDVRIWKALRFSNILKIILLAVFVIMIIMFILVGLKTGLIGAYLKLMVC